jgi:hypothetical protein
VVKYRLETLRLGRRDSEQREVFPLVRHYVEIATRILSKPDIHRNIVVLPSKSEMVPWVSVLTGLEVLKHAAISRIPQFKEGQRIILNGCLVEFINIESGPEPIVTVRCRDGLYKIPLGNVRQMQIANSSKRLAKLQELSPHNVQTTLLDYLLNIRTRVSSIQNRFILVAPLQRTRFFLENHCIENSTLIDLFQCGVIKADGSVESIKGDTPYDCILLISPDLYRIEEYLNHSENNTVSGIFVDGTRPIVEALHLVDEFFSMDRAPMIVFAALNEAAEIDLLAKRGFRHVCIDRDVVFRILANDKRDNPAFNRLRRAVDNFASDALSHYQCRFPLLEDLLNKNSSFMRSYKERESVHEILEDLHMLILSIARICWKPSDEFVAHLLQIASTVKQSLSKQRIWISKQDYEDLEKHCLTLEELIQTLGKEYNAKFSVFEELVSAYRQCGPMLIITKTRSEAEDAKLYWAHVLKSRALTEGMLEFLCIDDVNTDKLHEFETIIIAGWFKKSKLRNILFTYLCPRIIVLLYPFELTWFVKEYRLVKNLVTDKASGSIGDREKDLPLPRDEAEDLDTDYLEVKIQERLYRNIAIRVGNSTEERKARIIRLANGMVYFCADGHRPLIVKDLWEERDALRVSHHALDEIHPGDYLVIGESDRSVIRERVDSELERLGRRELRVLSRLWVDALESLLRALNGDFSRLVSRLALNGCTRHEATVRNWLQSSDIIAPQNLEDIRVIAKASRYEPLVSNVDRVIEAARLLRSLHLQAGFSLQRRMVEVLRQKVRDGHLVVEEDRIDLNLDEFGRLSILKIVDIGTVEYNIPEKYVNRLLSGGDLSGSNDSTLFG